MKRNFTTILIVLLILTIKCYGQSGLSMSVYGKVIDWNNNMPIRDFEVALFSIQDGITKYVSDAKTNEEGFYKIRYLEKGDYEYMIQVPGIGIIYVLNLEEGIDDNTYGFKLREGQNLNLNFSIGWAEMAEIKKEYIAPDIINITIRYPDDFLYDPDSQKRITRQNTTCNVNTGNVSETTVGDDVDLGTARNGQPAGGNFTPSFSISNVSIDCENDRCVLESIAVTISGSIRLHSEAWFITHYGTGYQNSIGSCLKECIRQHEQRHWNDAVAYLRDSFCNSVNSLNNVSAQCNCYLSNPEHYSFKCREELRRILQEYRTVFDNYMRTTSEDNAYGVSDPCCETCRNTHRNGGQQ